MRVVAGRARGRTLLGPPRGAEARPTSDRVREALFQILEPLEGTFVIDLYAGTGALGIEALSRGAKRAIFVERDRAMSQVLRKNIEALGLGDQATLVVSDVTAALRGPLAGAGPVDLVLLDPPYRATDQGLVLETLVPLLGADAIVAFEHAARDEPPDAAGLTRGDTRRWGDTAVSFYVLDGGARMRTEPEPPGTR